MTLKLEKSYQVGLAERDQLRIDPAHRDLKLPAFVKFHSLDPGSDCDPIFSQILFFPPHPCPFHTHLTLAFTARPSHIHSQAW